MDINQIADGLGITKGTLLASFLGAVLSLRWIDKSLSALIKWVMVVGGFLSANYGAPLLAGVLGMTGGTAGLAFFLGLFGMSLIDAVYSLFRDGTIAAYLRRRINP